MSQGMSAFRALVITTDEPKCSPAHSQAPDWALVAALSPLFSFLKTKYMAAGKRECSQLMTSHIQISADKWNYETLCSGRYVKTAKLWFISDLFGELPFSEQIFFSEDVQCGLKA